MFLNYLKIQNISKILFEKWNIEKSYLHQIEFKVYWFQYWWIEWNKRIWIIVQKWKECLNSLTDEDDKLLEGKEDEYMKEIEGEEKRIMLLEEYVIVEY